MTHKKCRSCSLPGSKRQTATGREGKFLNLGQHCRQDTAAQAFLNGPRHITITTGAQHQQVGRLQTEIAPTRAVDSTKSSHSMTALAYQNRIALIIVRKPRQQCSKEGGRRWPVRNGGTGRLMQTVHHQTGFRQGGVQSGNTEPPRF